MEFPSNEYHPQRTLFYTTSFQQVAVIIQFDMDPTLPVGWPDQGQELSRDLLAVSVREEEEEEEEREEDHPHHLEMRS